MTGHREGRDEVDVCVSSSSRRPRGGGGGARASELLPARKSIPGWKANIIIGHQSEETGHKKKTTRNGVVQKSRKKSRAGRKKAEGGVGRGWRWERGETRAEAKIES